MSLGSSLPHELLTRSGARAGFGLFPAMSVGAMMNWPDDRSDSLVQPKSSQPLAVIHSAPGATPVSGVNGPGPSPPAIVPIVWVP